MSTSPVSDRRPAVLALAGRRVDAPGAEQTRFPAANARQVQNRIQEQLRESRAAALVCSAACGADLLALSAAHELGIRSRVVLPFTREVFRRTSVTDRPGDWGERYDRILDLVESRNDLVVLGLKEGESGTYIATNEAILEQAVNLAQGAGSDVIAVVVWDEQSRGPKDNTDQFRRAAERREISVVSIATL
jgi:hypothetical protein